MLVLVMLAGQHCTLLCCVVLCHAVRWLLWAVFSQLLLQAVCGVNTPFIPFWYCSCCR